MRKAVLWVVLVVALAGCAGAEKGILVMAHGGDAAWNGAVEEAVRPLRARYPVEVAFGMARTSTLHEGVRRLEDAGVKRIAVVRLFVSGASFLERTEYIFGFRDDQPQVEHASHTPGGQHAMETPERIDTRCSLVLSRRGLVDSALIEEVLLDRVGSLSSNPAEESVLILAHGTGDDEENARWLAKMKLRARRLSELGPFRAIRCETLREDWPDKRAAAEKRIRRFVEEGNRDGGRVLVVPFRVSGFGPYREVLEGLRYVADGRGFLPHPNITRWIEQTAEGCFAEQDRQSPAPQHGLRDVRRASPPPGSRGFADG